ncbi:MULTISPECIES: hypothetical protein [unclassified Niallia]|uniref:hypothetical protein n=1 Tax=unclassified Niallia TaxID=2837522 RepID=UPI0030FA674F
MNQELLTDLELLNKFKQINFHKLDNFFSDFFIEYSDSIEIRHLNLMEDLYKKLKNAPVPNFSRFGMKQFYHREFYFDDEDFFSLYWDIELATKIIKRNKLKPEAVPVKYLLDGLTQLNPSKVQSCINFTKVNPIFIVAYDPHNTVIVIDGNHRVKAQELKRNPYIDAYLLNDTLSMECMAGDIFRYLYAVHTNATLLVNSIENQSYNGNLDDLLIKL